MWRQRHCQSHGSSLSRIVVTEHVGLAQHDDAALGQPGPAGHDGGVDGAERAVPRDERGAALLELDDAVVAHDARAAEDDVRVRVRPILVAADGRQTLFEVVQGDAGAQDVFVDANLEKNDKKKFF